jgi:hypothetical protein
MWLRARVPADRVGGLATERGALEPTGRVDGNGAGPHAVQGLEGAEDAGVALDDLLRDFLLEGEHDVLHLALEDVHDGEVALVRGLLNGRQDDRLSEVRVLELGALEGVGHGHRDGLEAVGQLGDRGVIAEDHRLLDAETAGDLDEVPVLLDGAEEGMGEVGVVDQLVSKELQRGRQNGLSGHDRGLSVCRLRFELA